MSGAKAGLAPFVHAIGRGPGRARPLTQDEAAQAMRLMLSGEAVPEAVGALLMLMRYRGETAAEIAGFAQAMRDTLPGLPRVDLDWPSYGAGRTRGLPWFLLAARLVARSGARVLLHGWNSPQAVAADLRVALPFAGIGMARDIGHAAALLDRDGIAYLPLEAFCPSGLRLLRLRETLGLRSCVNTVLRVLNPAGAMAAVQGVFHPPYRLLQQEACAFAGQERLSIVKGGGGEFERNPAKDTTLFRLEAGRAIRTVAPALLEETRRLADTETHADALRDLWEGRLHDPFAEAIVTGTAALALLTLGPVKSPVMAQTLAATLWEDRPRAITLPSDRKESCR